jgi:hypothetical protein
MSELSLIKKGGAVNLEGGARPYWQHGNNTSQALLSSSYFKTWVYTEPYTTLAGKDWMLVISTTMNTSQENHSLIITELNKEYDVKVANVVFTYLLEWNSGMNCFGLNMKIKSGTSNSPYRNGFYYIMTSQKPL